MTKKPLVLVILDGFGLSENTFGNAIAAANTPFLDSFFKKNSFCKLRVAGESVGLPPENPGNSEVGHTNIGAGRVVFQKLLKINNSIEEESFFDNDVLKTAMQKAKNRGVTLHLMGLISQSGIHGHISHLFALLKMAKISGLTKVLVHAWLDGRDSGQTSGIKHINGLENKLNELKIGQIVTICGRFYAMDRDNHLERTRRAFDAIAGGVGIEFENPAKTIEKSYKNNITDEFFLPHSHKNYNGMSQDDIAICFNFRADRARQIAKIITNQKINPENFVCFACYDKAFVKLPVVFESETIKNCLGEYLSNCGLKQLRVAESEKYAHITFFLNGGVQKPFEGEDRIIVASPSVRTYDLKPEMSADEITEKIIENIQKNFYDVVAANYANADMVGHTGDFKATVKAIKHLDCCLKKLYEKIHENGGTLVITADHGNAEKMLDENSKIFTSHTKNPVPFCISGNKFKLNDGKLCDIAPTILEILNLKKPAEMLGNSLICYANARQGQC